MLKTEQRLRKKKDIDAVYQSGRKGYTSFIRIVFLPTQNPESRFAVVVSNKVSKLAVDRNLIKRRIRSVVQELLPRFTKPYDVAVIAQQKAATLPRAQLFKIIDTLFSKNNFYGS